MPALPLPNSPARLDVRHRAPAPPALDIEPNLVALRIGALDEHLLELAVVINDRVAVLDDPEELIASSNLHVGDRVRLGH